MQSPKADIKPRDVANAAEHEIISLPHSFLMLLFRVSLSQMTGAGQSLGDDVQRDRASLDRKVDYLDDTFPKAFAAAAGQLSEPLEEARTTLLTALRDLLAALPEPDGAVDATILSKLATEIDESLAAAVSAFHAALFDQVVAHEKSTTQRTRDVDSEALDEIAQISRKIQFIAVNASVEAARVGDAGRGFSIIAAEIKSLSQQSKEAVDRVRAHTQ